MATLICSQGHPNPVGQRFCGDCGEDLTAPNPEPTDPATAAEASPGRPGGRYLLLALGAVIVLAAVTLVALLVTRSGSGPAGSPATTVVRGDGVWTWYFPSSTSDTEVQRRVDAACAEHPEVGSIKVNLVDTDVGNFDDATSYTYPCS